MSDLSVLSPVTGLPWKIVARLCFSSVVLWLRKFGFKSWALLSGILWIASGTLEIISGFAGKSVQNTYNLLGQLSGVFAAIAGIFSITEIWIELNTRHPAISSLANHRIRTKFQSDLGIEIQESTNTSCIRVSRSQFFRAIDATAAFAFVQDDAQQNLFTAINVLYYAAGPNGGTFKEKKRRNVTIRSRNHLAEMLIIQKNVNPAGISCILPMTRNDWETYLTSGIEDALFEPFLTAPYFGVGKSEFDVLLIFSIGLLKKKPVFSSSKLTTSFDDGTLIFSAIVNHIIQHLVSAEKAFIEEIYVTADDPLVMQALRTLGFRNTGMSTGLGVAIFQVSLELVD